MVEHVSEKNLNGDKRGHGKTQTEKQVFHPEVDFSA